MLGGFVREASYKPRFPAGAQELGIGVVGCGSIARSAHLPAYRKYGLRVVGVYDVRPEAARAAAEAFGARVFSHLEELLAHPEVAIVDVATHPRERIPIIRQALAAGKHVLAQKPLAWTLEEAIAVTEEAERRGLRLAVNQNGRWAPAWRVATLLVEEGAVGEVMAVTHLWDVKFRWIPGTPFDELQHFALYDYGIHWIDITRCWLGSRRVRAVRARDFRTPNQPPEGKTPWGAWVEIEGEEGFSGLIRGVGGAETSSPSHPFWIHGTRGTIRGSVLGADYVELEQPGGRVRFDLEGSWFPDGFAGTMGELMCAIAERREPWNSARHNLLTLALTLAACASAEEGGRPVAPALGGDEKA
jgi:predicted dehydrogenase